MVGELDQPFIYTGSGIICSETSMDRYSHVLKIRVD
jgi:hypothetical protein